MEMLSLRDVSYYNPVDPNWNPLLNPQEEAKYLAECDILLFPVTDETFAFGSLAETGFSILQALTSTKQRKVIIFIADDVCDELKEMNMKMAKESYKARCLVKAHLDYVSDPNVVVVSSMAEMFTEVDMLLTTSGF